jgi:membrane protein DedA with SNARE-associated domain
MSGMLGAWVQAEKMIQIALILPCAGFIGWLLGAWLDHVLHQGWISMAGIVFGILAGLVGAVKLTMVYARGPNAAGSDEDEPKKGKSDTNS